MNKQEQTRISIITPFFNEEESIEKFLEKLKKVTLTLENYIFEYIFIDDGSTDRTLNKLISITKGEPNIRIIEFSRNFGKEAALSAGIDYSMGDVTIIMDVDLQDPADLLPELFEKWQSGYVHAKAFI